MKILLVLFCLLLLSSCGTNKVKNSSIANQQKDEFYWIDDDDFEPTDEVVYRPVEDKYDFDTDLPNALSKETMVDVSAQELKTVMVESKDPLSKSVALCYQHRFNEAFKIFDQNYAKYRNHPGYWNQIGTCYLIQHEFHKAILYYHRARLKGKKSYAPAINNLGVIYVHRHEFQKALEAFKRASRVNSNAITPKLNMAYLYLRFGQLEKARRLLVHMQQMYTDDPTINSLLGTIALYKKNYQQALINFNFIPEKLLWRADYALNYSLALYLNGNKDKARKVFSKINRSRLGPLQSYYQVVKERIVK